MASEFIEVSVKVEIDASSQIVSKQDLYNLVDDICQNMRESSFKKIKNSYPNGVMTPHTLKFEMGFER